MQRLPLDTSTFSRLRGNNYLYVDKTEYIYRMVTQGHRFFLSRPRRFGKSLLVSTLYEILIANRSLFKNLWIDKSDYQWKEFGVINLDFSTLSVDTLEIFKNELKKELFIIGKRCNIDLKLENNTPNNVLKDLVYEAFNRFGRVAILVDEYDSPILKSLHNEVLAREIRDTIQQFFTIIKGLDAQVSFVFITGVSSFAKAGLFSGINNLRIITLQDQYATICGYTDAEVDHYFADRITAWAHRENSTYELLRQQIKAWYNGYKFGDHVPSVYNPFSLLNALDQQKFENFWFQSGTPTFLVELLKKQSNGLNIEKPEVSKDFLGVFDVDNIPIVSLMFQAGYFTISNYDTDLQLYQLDYPNEEVRISFQKYLLEVFAHISPFNADQMSKELRVAFIRSDIDGIVQLLKQLFAHVPYQLHVKTEKYYHSLFMMICIGAGIKAQSEYSTSLGRIDLFLEFPKIVYVIEVKFSTSADQALEQIKERRYYERFLNQGKLIILLGLSFKKEPNNFDIDYVVEKLD